MLNKSQSVVCSVAGDTVRQIHNSICHQSSLSFEKATCRKYD